jgi:hypothetical protein
MPVPSTPAPAARARRWQSPFAGMEELSFKRISDGWVFQAPNPWLIGPRQSYLLNDAQKLEVAAQLRRMWTIVLVTIIVLVAIGLPLWSSFVGDSHPLAMLGASTLFGAVAGFMVNAYTVRRMRPMIIGTEPTIQRITQREAILSQARIFSRARITFFGMLSAALLALTVTNAAVGGWNTLDVIGVLLFGMMTIYWLALLIVKHRAER